VKIITEIGVFIGGENLQLVYFEMWLLLLRRERERERERARAKRGVYGNVSYMDMKSYFYMDIYLNKWSRELQQESTGRPRVTV
jgi:hypothetical protein